MTSPWQHAACCLDMRGVQRAAGSGAHQSRVVKEQAHEDYEWNACRLGSGFSCRKSEILSQPTALAGRKAQQRSI